MNTISLCSGADGLFVKNERFNTTIVSFNFFTPLKAENISENSLLAYVLSSCCDKYKTFSQLNLALSMLYGANISISVNKLANAQYIKLAVSVINDKYSLDGEKNIDKAVNLLLSLIFEPKTENGSFFEEDLEREKRKVTELISAELNDKRVFARKRALAEMFQNSPYGLSALGDEKEIEKITGKELFNAWKRLLSTAYLRVNVIGKELPKGIFEKITNRFKNIERKVDMDFRDNDVLQSRDCVKKVKDNLRITQGKLVMGFSSEQNGQDAYALTVATDIFGGGPYSKLFENVREKMSLCYYCSAHSVKLKGYVMVDSGVEADKAEKAQQEILNQLRSVQQGDFSDFTFSASVKSLSGTLMAYNDSLSTLDAWYSLFPDADKLKTPEQVIDIIKSITRQEVAEAAKGIKLHTVYELMPLGDENNEN